VAEVTRAIGDELWHGAPETLSVLAAALAAPAQAVKANGRRTVECHPLPDGGAVYVKRFRDGGLGQTMKALAFGSRARREVEFARALAAAGVPVAEPLAWAEAPGRGAARGAVATRGVAGARPVIERLPAAAPDRRARLCATVAALLRRAHDAGIGFRDFHLGNVLADDEDRCTFIDLQSAWRPGPLLPRVRLQNLAMALTSIPRPAWPAARRALRAYGPLPGLPERILARLAAERAARLVLRHFRSRAERCVRDSSEFVRERAAGWRVFRRRDVDGAAVRALPAAALARLAARDATVLKDAPESAVVRGLRLGDAPVVVKRYRPRGLFAAVRQGLGVGRGRRAWIAGNTCRALGVAVATPLALLEAADGDAWLVMADLADHRPLDRHLAVTALPGPAAGRRALARRLGDFFGRLHAARVLHADCKACNVLVGPDGASVALVDYDRVHFVGLAHERDCTLDEEAEALTQLANSVPRAVGRADRLRFLHAYAAARGRALGVDVPALWRAVATRARARRIVWVGPAGDVHESWLTPGTPA
jgi:tRNA A-37 threonylcarbamoyl transferase component Bud32